MSDQPYQGGPYQGYDPHQQHPQWPGHPSAQGGYDPDDTQHWQGQTWETQTHAPVQPVRAAEETAYLPPVGESQGGRQYQQPYPQQQQYPQPQYQQQPYPQQGFQQQDVQHDRFAGSYGGGVPQGQPQPVAQPQPQPMAHSGAQPMAQPQPQPQPVAEAAPAPAPVAAGVAAPAAGASEDGPAYGPATLAGNARITDAQRARLEGRSPIIEPGMQPALLTAVLGLLLAGAAGLGTFALVVPLVVLQAVTAAGWFRLNGMWPARQGIALAFLGGLVADAAVLAAGRGDAPAAILGTLGVWVLLSLVLQLRSHASPDERMYGLMATVASAALAIVATGYLGADPHAASVGAAAVAVAALARALPLPTPVSIVVSLLAAAGAGIAVGGMTGFGTKGALLGALAAACALIGHRVASYDYPSRFVHFTAGVALPLSAAAPVVWALGRVLG
ncbi:hypothetical protein SAMN04490357_4281 [Streptomyces misionensis]|uniref:Uncharacterized protein n=1 Tax=Streptomyces misionensis TaxID=67331 RepID=A0A1H4Z4W2_9ACTN|nr:hypothetical protein [Streptomyces misionensis]SED25239.1 hypothetical protein SAMN04490357_4281 [Streptomyces misionensis]